MTQDQMFRIIGTAIFIPIVLWVLRFTKKTISDRYETWSKEGGGVPYRVGRWYGKLRSGGSKNS